MQTKSNQQLSPSLGNFRQPHPEKLPVLTRNYRIADFFVFSQFPVCKPEHLLEGESLGPPVVLSEISVSIVFPPRALKPGIVAAKLSKSPVTIHIDYFQKPHSVQRVG